MAVPGDGNGLVDEALPAADQASAASDSRGVSSRPEPPARDREWTAEIEWRQRGAAGRFCVVARGRHADYGVLIARSTSLPWPPKDEAAVQTLVDATEALRSDMLAAGWETAERGAAWYSLRFAWVPDETVHENGRGAPEWGTRPPSRAAAAAGRRPEWPEETERTWRCAIRWESNLVRARFTALVHPPQRGGPREIARSETFWGRLFEPDPENAQHRAAANALVTALERAGWVRLPGGRSWYPERFVWRREGAPPAELELP